MMELERFDRVREQIEQPDWASLIYLPKENEIMKKMSNMKAYQSVKFNFFKIQQLYEYFETGFTKFLSRIGVDLDATDPHETYEDIRDNLWKTSLK
jgi:hypothetical protein